MLYLKKLSDKIDDSIKIWKKQILNWQYMSLEESKRKIYNYLK